MAVFAAIFGGFLIATALWDAFETVVLPRRVSRRFRLARLFYRRTWSIWSTVARRLPESNQRETYLSYYGPLSLIFLLVSWSALIVVGFALLHWGLRTNLTAAEGVAGFGTLLYASGTTFFTLGLGDVITRSSLGRALMVVEVAAGFGLLALVISYLPVLYQAFSRREISISLLDARAGSPPSAVEILRRHQASGDLTTLQEFLQAWERWAAELLEAHLSYAVLAYYRSQHERQSWVSSLTTILDLCALLLVGVDHVPAQAAQFTFAMARHAAVDLSQVFGSPGVPGKSARFQPADLGLLREILADAGIPLRAGHESDEKLERLRQMYEPHVSMLATYLLMPLPPWIPGAAHPDAWETSAWDRGQS